MVISIVLQKRMRIKLFNDFVNKITERLFVCATEVKLVYENSLGCTRYSLNNEWKQRSERNWRKSQK